MLNVRYPLAVGLALVAGWIDFAAARPASPLPSTSAPSVWATAAVPSEKGAVTKNDALPTQGSTNARVGFGSGRDRVTDSLHGVTPSQLAGMLETNDPPRSARADDTGRRHRRPESGSSRRGRQSSPLRLEAGQLYAGAAVRSITPTKYETFFDLDGDATYEPPEDTYYDAGVDRLFDPEEPGALGGDGKPGRAGIDDNGNGVIDEVGEYLATGSDDVKDSAGDNYDSSANPEGTEGNGSFESVALAGFQGLLGEEIRPMQGVHDELNTRALAVTRDGTSSILIVNDLIGLLFHYMNPVKRDLERTLGVPFDNIIIASTHTHAGPDTVGLWAGDVNDEYIQSVMDAMYEAAAEAWEQREPVQVKSATTQPFACFDRETMVLMTLLECSIADYEAANFNSTSEYDQHILQNDLRDPWVERMEVSAMQFVAADGSTVASLLNFDNHPELMLDENPLASSDFPHYAREKLEASLGGVAIYITGTVGSQMGALRGTPIPMWDEADAPVYQSGVYDVEGNPVPLWATGAENRVRSMGYALGEYALQALERAAFTVDPALTLQTQYLDVSINNPLYRLLLAIIRRDPNFHEMQYWIHADYCSISGCLRLPITVMTLGDATFLTAPGEFPPEYLVGRGTSVAPYSQTDPPYEDYAFPAMPALRDHVKTRDIIFVGLANMYLGYAIPESDTLGYQEMEHPNYYEEYYDPNVCFGDSVGNRLMEMLGSTERFGDCVAYPLQSSSLR